MIIYKLIAILSVIVFIIYKKLKKIYSVWEEKGVKGPKPNWLVGNMMPVLLQEESMNTFTKQLYDMYPDERVVGMYQHMTPTLIVRDPILIRNILVKDFSTFTDRGFKITKEKQLENVFVDHGEKWKVYRQTLNPLFSTGTMKGILPNTVKHIVEYLQYIENLPDGPKELSTLDHKLSIKLVMSNGFGVTVDPYDDDTEDIAFLRKIGYGILKLKIRDIIGTMLHGYNPGLPDAIGFKFASRELEDFMKMLTSKSLKAKEDNPDRMMCTIDYLLKMNEKGVVIKEKEDGVIKVNISDSFEGHALLFYVAGFEIYAPASFLFYELALHPKVQERCYAEIVRIMDKYNGDLAFEALEELEYLSMAFDESVRKYPMGGFLTRVARKDYHFEDINLTIEKGTRIIVPTLAFHNDPKYFPNPEVFDPERFSPENRKKIQNYTYLPFGDGPRKCIGSRFARFHFLLMVSHFLHRYQVTPCEKTAPNVRLTPYQFSMGAKDGLWVNITKRKT